MSSEGVTWPKALKTYTEVENELANDTKVKIAGVDLTGILRGKVISKEKFLACVKHGSLGFCSVLFGWDLQDATYKIPSIYSSNSNGFADFQAKVDLSTFRRIPWENNLAFFLVDYYLSVEEILPVCSRNMLKGHVKHLFDLGLEPLCGIEFEWFNFKETPNSLAEKQGRPTFLTPGMFGYSLLRPSIHQAFFDDIFDECKRFGIDVEGLHTESGPGVFEAALTYCPAMRMADNAALFKTSVKQLGLRHGIIASFMAKPFASLPGCSGHIHLSLKHKSGGNAFSGENSAGTSHLLEHFVAGLVVALPSIMCILAPTINSYKRVVENYWAPVKVSWGYENRLAAIRLITPPACSPVSTRIEVRVPGADINPYLAISAVLAAGYHGVSNKLVNPLPILKPGELISDYPGQPLPKNLKEATELMAAKDSVARSILGDEFVDHYVLACRNEILIWEQAVTDWELNRYVELV